MIAATDSISSAEAPSAPPPAPGPGTHFAPAGRWTLEELLRASEALQSVPLLQKTIEALPDAVAILNDKRQVVLANRTLLEIVGRDQGEVLGRRPGELLGCARWKDGPDGCGTAPHCACCGAVAAILESMKDPGKVSRECRMACEGPEGRSAKDLLVTARRFDVDGRGFTLVSMEDIGDRKRLRVLAKAFFHDVLNTAGGIQGYAQFLASAPRDSSAIDTCLARLAALADQIVEEIGAHRDLMCAEAGDLTPQIEDVRAGEVLDRLHALYANHTAGLGKSIVVDGGQGVTLRTDGRLLSRVLGNMLKNALEATPTGGTVTVRCRKQAGQVAFSVHNPGVMPPEVQMQVFQRSFSTKGEPGRGIGTHSMKLLGERYLRGQVSFTSRDPEGTTFTLTLPVAPG